jgi:WD40 repeat protein
LANQDGDITVISIKDLRQKRTIRVPRYTRTDNGLPNGIRSVAIANDLSAAALGTEDGTVVLFDLKEERETTRWSRHKGMVTDLAADAAWQRLASASQDGKLTIWRLSDRQALVRITTGASMAINPVHGFGFSADGTKLDVSIGHYLKYLSIPSEGDEIFDVKLADLKTTALTWCGSVGQGLTSSAIDSVAATGESDRVIVGCQDGAVKTAGTESGWDPVYGVQDRDLANVSFDVSGKHLVVSTWNNVTVSDWDLTTGERIGHWKTDKGWGGAQVTSRGMLLYTGFYPGGGIRVENLSNPAEDPLRIGDEGTIGFSPDGEKALVRRTDGVITLYDLRNQKLEWQRLPEELHITQMLGDPIFTGDGKEIVIQDVPLGQTSARSYGEAVLVSLASGMPVGRVRQQGQTFAAGPNGRRFATGRFEDNDTTRSMTV